MSLPLIDRDAELAALDAALTAARDDGAVVVVEGQAGIGKTALLHHLRDAARASGATVLAARASELDRSFGYGVVHQLLDPVLAGAGDEQRAALLRGAAANAEIVLSAAGQPAEDGEYAVVHGLYWFVVNLSERGPLVLLVDDLQWADGPSLRFLEYLARRLEGLPVLVAATLRTNEPSVAPDVIGELAHGPSTRRIVPRPLGADATAGLLGAALGNAPDPEFAAAAAEATGGNPLLLRVVAREAEALGLRGAADEGAGLTELAARGVVPIVQRRLRSLGDGARDVARAAAVVGERATLADLAHVAAVGEEVARPVLDRLAEAGVLDPGGWTFVHPLVKAAVLEDCPPSELATMHARAARCLRERGARLDEIALHWLEADPAGDPSTVDDLRDAAALAAAEGALEVAVAQLRRALDEPPAAELRREVALDLAELEIRAQQPEGPARLRVLLEEGLSGNDAARARAALGNHLVQSDPISALDEVASAMQEATDAKLRLQLEAFTLEALIFPDVFAERRDARLEQGRMDPHPSPAMLAHLAVQGGCAGLPADEVRTLAERALSDGTLMHHVGPTSSTWNLLTHALRFAEADERCSQVLTEGERIVRRRGHVAAQLFIDQSWGYWHRDFGSVATGAARARLGHDAILDIALPLSTPALAAIAAENLIELGDLEQATELIDRDLEPATNTYIEPFALVTRGWLRHLLRRHEEAEHDLRRVIELSRARGWHAPNATRAELRLAYLLASRGRREEALALADEMVGVARAANLRGGLGMALRARAAAVEGDEAIDVLREAVATLQCTPFQLELGWAQHDLGARLRIRGDRKDARDPLRAALDIAARAEAGWLGKLAHDELAASGARPRRERLSGAEALTPAERRVAELAAEGLTNREIAEQLWVTLKTVEVHLGRSYAKLGIASRKELAGVLGAPAVAA